MGEGGLGTKKGSEVDESYSALSSLRDTPPVCSSAMDHMDDEDGVNNVIERWQRKGKSLLVQVPGDADLELGRMEGDIELEV
jgi:hypothetical protein